jgi:hypothetical protein
VKKHFKINENNVMLIQNLTGIGPTQLSEAVISFSNRDVYMSTDETASKYGFLYISGYQHPSIINDFYKITFTEKATALAIIEEYIKSKD